MNNTGTPGLGVSSGTGLGSLSVLAGAELAGRGRIEIQNAVAAFASGSRLAPGGGLDNSLRIQTNGGPGDFDFTLTTWEVDGTGVSFELGERYSYWIGRALGTDAITSGPLNVTDQSRFAAVGFEAIDWSLTSDSGGAIYVNFTPVPEPGAILLIAAASFWMARRVRHVGRCLRQPQEEPGVPHNRER